MIEQNNNTSTKAQSRSLLRASIVENNHTVQSMKDGKDSGMTMVDTLHNIIRITEIALGSNQTDCLRQVFRENFRVGEGSELKLQWR